MKNILILSLSLSLLSLSSFSDERVDIVRKGKVTNSATFSTHAEAEEWVKRESENGSFGKAAHKKCEALLMSNPPKEADCIDIPSEFEVQYTDITTQVDTERQKREAKKADRLTRIELLKSLDINKVTTIAQLKTVVATLVKEVLKDEE